MTNVLNLSWQRVVGAMTMLVLASALLFSFASPVAAADCDGDGVDDGICPTGRALTADELLPSTFTDETGLGNADLEGTIGALIKTVIRFLGIVAVIIVLYGGFKWMTASGNDEKVAEAKRVLIAGLIGLAIVLTALAITNFAFTQILTATSESI